MIVDHVLAAEGVIVTPVEVQLRVLVDAVQGTPGDRRDVVRLDGDGHYLKRKKKTKVLIIIITSESSFVAATSNS